MKNKVKKSDMHKEDLHKKVKIPKEERTMTYIDTGQKICGKNNKRKMQIKGIVLGKGTIHVVSFAYDDDGVVKESACLLWIQSRQSKP